ncbi:putative outer membrane protein [Xenorhabdus mauleonii]|uniref:Outer membrane protein n=1 Tax=Xenorhabdus mauleonii TaxID=351675 RepID=A0A2G0PF62_9GAMM|nr:putative outer membrane protein [Xenorhabdus mauleonii]
MELEISGEVIVMSILPANFAGQQNLGGIKKVTTVPGSPGNNTSGGNKGAIVDPDAKPIVNNLELHGMLQVGKTIRGKYHFDANKGDPVDHSVYTWYQIKAKANEGADKDKIPSVPDETAEKVVLLKKAVPSNGTVPEYTLEKSDSLYFIRLEVQRMFKGQPFEAPLVVTSNLVGDDGNGNKNLAGGGSPSGRVIDPAIGPVITKLTLVPEEVDGKTYLAATYQFDHNGGETSDASHYTWGDFAPDAEFTTRTEVARDGSPVTPGQDIRAQPHKVPRYHKPLEDLYGRVIALSVLAKSGTASGKIGDIQDQDTKKSNTVVSTNTDGTIKGIADKASDTWDTKGKEVVEIKGKSVVKLQARENLLDNAEKGSMQWAIQSLKGGKPIGGVPVTISLSATGRSKGSATVTANVEVVKGVLGGGKNTYTGHTDHNGDLVINITDPDGKGVITKLSATLNDESNNKVPVGEKEVMFTVITSPDVKEANYWGHMPETVFISGKGSVTRPRLSNENLVGDKGKYPENNEDWATVNWEAASRSCTLPDRSTAQELYNNNTGGKDGNLAKIYGWPFPPDGGNFYIWTRDSSSSNGYRYITLNTGIWQEDGSNTGGGEYLVCVKK